MSKNHKIEIPWFQKDIKLIRNCLWARVHKTTYATVNLTALCIIFSKIMRGAVKFTGA